MKEIPSFICPINAKLRPYTERNSEFAHSCLLKNSDFYQIIKNISSNIPNFYAGRYDIGYLNLEQLKKVILKYMN